MTVKKNIANTSKDDQRGALKSNGHGDYFIHSYQLFTWGLQGVGGARKPGSTGGSGGIPDPKDKKMIRILKLKQN